MTADIRALLQAVRERGEVIKVLVDALKLIRSTDFGPSDRPTWERIQAALLAAGKEER